MDKHFRDRMTDVPVFVSIPTQCVSFCALYMDEDIIDDEYVHVCPAFPQGIPADVVVGDVIHDKVLDGQVGTYIFTPKSPPEET